MKHGTFLALFSLICCTVVGAACRAGAAEQPDESRLYFSPGIGWLDFEGDEAVEDGFLLNARLGYDYNEWWTIEAEFSLAPKLDERMYGKTFTRTNSLGQVSVVDKRDVSRLEDTAGAGVHDCFALGIGIDAMFHFTRWERLDPYLGAGIGMRWYSEEVAGGQTDLALRGGGGVMYHFNDEWALRGDARVYLAGKDVEANSQIDVSLLWYWGAQVPPDYVAEGGALDSDGDGLIDSDETIWKTDRFNPDTDGDGLRDGPEVHTWRTNPLDKDTDMDGLTDGQEVFRYKTIPTKRDTDDGGVADGHEVIEDNTNPLDGSDDLMLVELNIQFDYDKAIIKPVYFGDLNKIVKVMQRNPNSSARIEGHADKNRKSSESHNLELSQHRAESVMNYIEKTGGIAAGRLSAKGYGFSRPKAPNDPKLGNPVNRRVEVYIRGAQIRE